MSSLTLDIWQTSDRKLKNYKFKGGLGEVFKAGLLVSGITVVGFHIGNIKYEPGQKPGLLDKEFLSSIAIENLAITR